MCDPTNNKSYGLGITDLNESRKRIISILDDIMFLAMVLQYCGSWLSNAAAKLQRGLWKCYPPVDDT